MYRSFDSSCLVVSLVIRSDSARISLKPTSPYLERRNADCADKRHVGLAVGVHITDKELNITV